MAVVASTENLTSYTCTLSGTMEAIGTTVRHFRMPYVDGMQGEPLKALIEADVTLTIASVTYLPEDVEFDVAVLVDDSDPPGSPPSPDYDEQIEDVYDTYVGGL